MKKHFDWIQFGVGMVYKNRGNLKDAEEKFKEILNRNPEYGFAYVQLGQINKVMGLQDQTLTYFQQAVDCLPEDEMGYYQLGLIYLELKAYRSAKDRFLKVLEFNPSHVDALVNIALINGAEGDFDQAALLIKEAYQKDPDCMDGFARLGWIKAEKNDWNGAIELMDYDRKAGRLTAHWKTNLAEIHARSGDFNTAETLIAQAYIENEDIRDAYARMGWIKAENRDYAGALELMQKDDRSNRLTPHWRINLAETYGRSSDYDAAENMIEQAYHKNPDLKDGYARLGWIMADHEHLRHAVAMMEKDYGENRLSSAWKVNYAILLGRQGEINRAENLINEAYADNPELKDGYARLGWVVAENRDWDNAQRMFKMELDLNRMTPIWKINYASIKVHQHCWSEALSIISDTYSEDAAICDGYSLIGWEGYLLGKGDDYFLELVAKDAALGRLSSPISIIRGLYLIVTGAMDQKWDEFESSYLRNNDARNWMASIGWLCVRLGNVEKGCRYMAVDVTLRRLDRVWIPSYAVALSLNGRSDLALQSLKTAAIDDTDQLIIGYQTCPDARLSGTQLKKLISTKMAFDDLKVFPCR